MRLLASGLRTLVVTLDPKRNELQKDAPAAMLRTLGHSVEVVGYDLAELKGTVDVALVEAGEHLEIGRHAIRRLRQRPDLVATRILLCIEVGRVSGLDPEMGADDFILMPVSAEELAARLRQLHARDKRPGSPLQVRYGEIVLDCEMRQAYLRGETLASPRTSSSCSASSPTASAGSSPARSCCRACGATATSAASAPWTPTC